MTKQQLLALLREAMKLADREYMMSVDALIEEINRTNRVGDLELPDIYWHEVSETPKEQEDLLLVCAGLVEQGVFSFGEYWEVSCQYKLYPTAWMYEPQPPEGV